MSGEDEAAQKQLEDQRYQDCVAAIEECISRKVATPAILVLIRETGVNVKHIMPLKRSK